MALKIDFNTDSLIPIDATPLVPEKFAKLSMDRIRAIRLLQGNKAVELDSLANITGSPTDQHLSISGSIKNVDRIGQGMAHGKIQIFGDVGHHVANKMSGGEVSISGNAGNFLGAEMTGGNITVKENAGNDLGGQYPGSKFGMNRGSIIVSGNVGKRTGQGMRRGTIVVGGNALSGCGSHMRAGTILVGGNCGPDVGSGMVRGTIVIGGVLSNPAKAFDKTFRETGNHHPIFLKVIVRWLQQNEFDAVAQFANQDFDVFAGDQLYGCRGELFLARSR